MVEEEEQVLGWVVTLAWALPELVEWDTPNDIISGRQRSGQSMALWATLGAQGVGDSEQQPEEDPQVEMSLWPGGQNFKEKTK